MMIDRFKFTDPTQCIESCLIQDTNESPGTIVKIVSARDPALGWLDSLTLKPSATAH